MRPWWSELVRRDRVAAWGAALHVLMFGVAVLLSLVDSRQVFGINSWIKPIKFMASIAIYLATIAWIVGYLKGPRWAVRTVTGGITLSMLVETVCLFIQAGRGTHSHYNTGTAFDASIFSAMGLGIAVDTILMVALLGLFARNHLEIPASLLWGIRLGIVTFLVGSWVGGQMIAGGAHTVGAPDGGPGLPFLNWSTEAGDLRIAHALGLHGLQLLPLLGWLLRDRDRSWALAWLLSTTVAWGALLTGAFLQAKAGQPLIAG